MLPHERSLVKKLKNRPFAIVGINSDKPGVLKKLVDDGTVTWRSFVNKQKDGEISQSWGVHAWPTLFILDHEGVIRYKGLRGEKMEKAILDLVEKAEKSSEKKEEAKQ